MAITYTQNPSEATWNFSENNAVFEFSSDSAQEPLYCDIDINGLDTIRIYPLPDGYFWCDLKNYLSSLLNDYDDDLDLSSIDALDIDTFIFDWSQSFWSDGIDFTITFDDDSTDSETITIYMILAKEDLIDYKKGRTVRNLSQFIMSPLKRDTANRFYMKYWEGYPFDFGLTRNVPVTDTVQTITNNTNAITSDPISFPYNGHRVFISDGDTDITLEDYLPLADGYNELELEEDSSSIFLELWKHQADCGVYIKWLNQYGGYNYWLFNDEHIEQLGTKSKGFVNNDFSNIDETVSPMRSLGREVENEITVRAEHLISDDIDVLRGIVESPKIYLFTGTRYTSNTFNDWVEVNIKNTTMPLRDFKGNVPDVELTFELPNPITINL